MDQTQDTYGEEETARIRDAAVRRALSTPPHPKPTLSRKKEKPASPASEEKPARSGGAS